MKLHLFFILLFSFSLVSANTPDCWRLDTEKSECIFVSFENCTDIFYDDFYECERDRLAVEYRPKNIIQTSVENLFPDYESESLTKLYGWSNMQIFLLILFSYLFYWVLSNG